MHYAEIALWQAHACMRAQNLSRSKTLVEMCWRMWVAWLASPQRQTHRNQDPVHSDIGSYLGSDIGPHLGSDIGSHVESLMTHALYMSCPYRVNMVIHVIVTWSNHWKDGCLVSIRYQTTGSRIADQAARSAILDHTTNQWCTVKAISDVITTLDKSDQIEYIRSKFSAPQQKL